MKKKIPRMVAFLLALVLTAGIATPASAAPDTFITVNGQEYHVGNLIYDYDQVPANMKYNFVIIVGDGFPVPRAAKRRPYIMQK